MQVNILEAKTNLSNLVKLIETGKEDMVVIARYGKPIVGDIQRRPCLKPDRCGEG